MVDASTGIISTIAGSYPSGTGTTADGDPAIGAKLTGPYHLEYRASEYALYIGGFGDNNIRRIQLSPPSPPLPPSPLSPPPLPPKPPPAPPAPPAPPGAFTITTAAGSKSGVCGTSGVDGPLSALLLCQPMGVVFDPSGNMFIGDQWDRGGRILRIDATTSTVTNIIATPVVSQITQMIFVASGDMYFTNWGGNLGNSVIRLAAGTYSPSVFSTGPYSLPNGIVSDENGNFYVSDGGNHQIYKLSAAGGTPTVFAGTGVAGFAGDGGPATAAQFFNPFQLAFDSAGDLYITNIESHSVRKITMSTGIVSTVAGTSGQSGYSGDGGLATLAKLYGVYGLAFDGDDNM